MGFLGGVGIERDGGDPEFVRRGSLRIGGCLLGRLEEFGGWMYEWDRQNAHVVFSQ